MKISKDTYLVVLTAEETKALKMFFTGLSKANASAIYKKYASVDALTFEKLNNETDFLFKIFQQVEDA